MPRCLVRGPNDRYAIWSSVVDNFLLIDATLEEAIAFELGSRIYADWPYPGGDRGLVWDMWRAVVNIKRTGRAWHWAPTLETAIEKIIAVHGSETESLDVLRECGWLT